MIKFYNIDRKQNNFKIRNQTRKYIPLQIGPKIEKHKKHNRQIEHYSKKKKKNLLNGSIPIVAGKKRKKNDKWKIILECVSS